MINESIFKTYDVRGIYPTEINEKAVYIIAKSYAKWLKKNVKKETVSVAVGYDMRSSSISLFQAVSGALQDENVNIISLGLTPTPLVGFFVAKENYDGGIIISASHSAKEFNALKLLKRENKGILQIGKNQGLLKIKNASKKIHKSFNIHYQKSIGYFKKSHIVNKKVYEKYIQYLAEKFKFSKKLNVAADYGNGMGGLVMPKALKKFGFKSRNFFVNPDGNFPNHDPNPHEEKNFNFLKNKLKTKNYDIGLFFDGDCDRVFFVDEQGEIVQADMILTLLTENELEKGLSENKVYYDLRSSRALKEILEKKGASVIRMPTGNPLIKEKLIREDGILGGEMSGHIMFKEHFCLDDGFYTALKILEIMDKKNKLLSELIKPYKKYFKIHERNIHLKQNQNPKKLIKKLDKKFKTLYPKAKFDYLDGITVEHEDWWFNIRPSNTENVIRLNLEAKKKQIMEEKVKEIISIIKKFE